MRLPMIGALAATLIAAACAEDASGLDPEAANATRESDVRDAAAGGPEDPEAEGGKPPSRPVPGVHAEYFDGYHDRKLERVDPTIDHAWKAEAPGPGIGKDRFSARFTGTLTPDRSGKTTLAVDADDGMRLWVDGKLVIDDWKAHFVERHTADVELVAGQPVAIRIDYFEADLDASLRLSWLAPDLPEEVIGPEHWTTTDEPTGLPGPKPPFANPVIAANCPDPGVLGVMEGTELTFYAACTGGRFPVRTSRDLVSWSALPGAAILPAGKPTWAANAKRNWAPEIHRAGDGFLAYYTSVNGADVLSIGVAKAPAPEGPWTDKGGPLVEDAKGVIDATFFEDDDGSRWLFFKIDGNSVGQPTPIFVQRLAADGLSFAPGSARKQVLVNDGATWEGGVVEAPWVVKRDGTYYMFYSGNVFDHRYRTGVARASTLTGAWQKKGAPILTNNAAWVGPGHGSVVSAAKLDYFVYHAWQNAGNGTAVETKGRMVLVDRIRWEGGWPVIANGSPSSAAQPWPGEPR